MVLCCSLQLVGSSSLHFQNIKSGKSTKNCRYDDGVNKSWFFYEEHLVAAYGIFSDEQGRAILMLKYISINIIQINLYIKIGKTQGEDD